MTDIRLSHRDGESYMGLLDICGYGVNREHVEIGHCKISYVRS